MAQPVQLMPRMETVLRCVVSLAVYRYEANLNNLKIQAPSDDNYSDDELTFLP